MSQAAQAVEAMAVEAWPTGQAAQLDDWDAPVVAKYVPAAQLAQDV